MRELVFLLEEPSAKAMLESPDALGSPSKELKTLTGNRYVKVAGSRAIGMHLNLDNDRSPSFRNLIAAIRRMENELNQVHA